MGQNYHRMEIVHRYYAPVHVAFRGLQYPACQYGSGDVPPLQGQTVPPFGITPPIGHLHAKDAADFAFLREIGCCRILPTLRPRCRGPPPFHLRTYPKTDEMEDCQMTVINHTRNKPRRACRKTDLAGLQHVLSSFPIPVPAKGQAVWTPGPAGQKGAV